MPVVTITKRAVDAAQPADRDGFLWDRELKGFGLKVTPAGAKIYLVQYRTGGRGAPTRRVTIGRHGAPWTPDLARREAKRILGQVAGGVDPGAVRQEDKASLTMAALVKAFMTQHVEAKRKPRSAAEYHRLFDNLILPELGGKRVKEITRSDVSRLHHALRSTPYQANRVLAVLSKLFNWAEQHDHRPDASNPCRHVEKYREEPRERFLSPAELGRLGRALTKSEREGLITPWMAGAIRLLVFTGARLSEILTARWDWVDLPAGTLTLPDSKTGRKTIHLNPPALEVMNSLPRVAGNSYLIAGRKQGAHLVNLQKPWRLVRAHAGLDDVRVHDLRHSFASVAAAGGFSLPLIGAMLGHSQPATTARYAHLAADPVKAASATVGDKIAAAMFARNISEARSEPIEPAPRGAEFHDHSEE